MNGQPLKILLVDDERLARAELRRLLAPHVQQGAVEIVGEAASAADAITQISKLRPDLLLLDVQMPGGSGFDLLAALDDAPDVIFCTAFDQYALQAFEVSALDYLQKPVQAARLATALARAGARAQAVPPPAPRKVFIKDGERCWFVAFDDIRLLESEGNYTRAHFGEQRPLMLRTLNQLEEKLGPALFLRANRRQIVNLAQVAQLSPNGADGLDLHLLDGSVVEVSRRRAQQFKAACGL
ncbi:LytTR family DNA-binding domain-containing protein [Janthinobacterium sp. PLB04]|uniref:Response regulator transcription factor n=1 Tax=Janthinobacterium lividum TaxID=29581 RepID=A0AAJ4T755_9BURK|nr:MULTISPECIES: LytTR family DNA-binding domain-containing protein [Janthinobacterium]KAB0331738.1 response regulator transcription factor [Janthinobacterium lividum]QSX97937.1 response regulator transcription factor [Janthinobacterium lividum]UGQ37906.1 LytTR family DNA-binding domain-containing protein [Janthinobacterium sp. PLB04]